MFRFISTTHVCAAFILIESENQELSEMRGEKKPCASFILEIVACRGHFSSSGEEKTNTVD